MMDLDTYLKTRQNHVETALDACLPPKDRPPSALHQAMRYAVFSGGKRFRPVLCCAAADAARGTLNPVIDSHALTPACAVECFHCYTLVHDDLPCMDDDNERRGKPTVHIEFGNAMAVLAGDALQTLAFEILSRTAPSESYGIDAFVRELATAAGSLGVVGGQVDDLAASTHAPTREQLEHIHRRKTAALFVAAVRLGAMTANATPSHLHALTVYAENLGMAFQITDDLLDAADQTNDPASCVTVFGETTARTKANDHVAAAVSALDVLPNDGTEPLRTLAQRIAHRTQ